ncbi:hypothetical protein [Streptomyces sp. NBC_00691]|uniref:hypothetical protein n=1 Tax=Streptomyces sp. NBC_00691 TaxID=2903671 RepID=UPI002E373E4D|nr:hypothetical protein [Streptomyces sp. NBC_00691]
MTAPATDGSGQISAMRKALAQARLAPEHISHIDTHTTGTPVGDVAETHAIGEVFGRATVTTLKAALGDPFGAAGAIEALMAVQSAKHGVIPPTRPPRLLLCPALARETNRLPAHPPADAERGAAL